jgi:hypothetical protein
MSDRPGIHPTPTGGQPAQSPGEAYDQLRQDASRAASAVTEQAGQAASAVRREAESALGDVAQQGQALLHSAADRAEDALEQGRQLGAERAQGLARAIQRAADDLDETSPEIARHVRSASDAVQGIAQALQQRSAGELMEEVTAFARRQPAAFFGAAALAGFALARFAKASAPAHGMGRHAMGEAHPAPATMAPGWTREEDGALGRPATMAAASLGGAAAHHQHSQSGGAMPHGSETRSSADDASFPSDASSQGAGRSTGMPNERSGTPL